MSEPGLELLEPDTPASTQDVKAPSSAEKAVVVSFSLIAGTCTHGSCHAACSSLLCTPIFHAPLYK